MSRDSVLALDHFRQFYLAEVKVTLPRSGKSNKPVVEELNELLSQDLSLAKKFNIGSIKVTPEEFIVTTESRLETVDEVIFRLQEHYTTRELFEFIDSHQDGHLMFKTVGHLAMILLHEAFPDRHYDHSSRFLNISKLRKTKNSRSISIDYSNMSFGELVRTVERTFKNVEMCNLKIEMIESHIESNARIVLKPTFDVQETYDDLIKELLKEKDIDKILYCNAYQLSDYYIGTNTSSHDDKKHNLEVTRRLLREPYVFL